MNNRNRIRSIVSWGVLLLVCVIAASLISTMVKKDTVKYSDIVGYFKDEQVTEFEIVGNKLTYKLVQEGETPEKEKSFVRSSVTSLD